MDLQAQENFQQRNILIKYTKFFFETAMQNQKQKFIIKLKFNNVWKNKILEIKKKIENKIK